MRLGAENLLDGETVGRLAEEGYPRAVAAAQELAHWLGRGLVSITNTFNPEMIVVGGGVADLGELVLAPAREYLERTAMAPNKDEVRVVRAALGNAAGIVGAGLAAWETCGADAPSGRPDRP